MNTTHPLTITIDQELSDAWSRLYPFKQRSFTEFLREVLAKETLKYTITPITDEVRNFSGTLPTTLDYKELRDIMVTERIADYENLR